MIEVYEIYLIFWDLRKLRENLFVPEYAPEVAKLKKDIIMVPEELIFILQKNKVETRNEKMLKSPYITTHILDKISVMKKL